MSGDDWQVGDLALRVAPIFRPDSLLKQGRIYTVEELDRRDPILGLYFEGIRRFAIPGHSDSYDHRCFVKVTPPEADEFDRETIALLTGKPATVPA